MLADDCCSMQVLQDMFDATHSRYQHHQSEMVERHKQTTIATCTFLVSHYVAKESQLTGASVFYNFLVLIHLLQYCLPYLSMKVLTTWDKFTFLLFLSYPVTKSWSLCHTTEPGTPAPKNVPILSSYCILHSSSSNCLLLQAISVLIFITWLWSHSFFHQIHQRAPHFTLDHWWHFLCCLLSTDYHECWYLIIHF